MTKFGWNLMTMMAMIKRNMDELIASLDKPGGWIILIIDVAGLLIGGLFGLYMLISTLHEMK